MKPKKNGFCVDSIQDDLKFGVDRVNASTICCFIRSLNDPSSYAFDTKWIEEITANGDNEFTYYDSVTGKPLFIAPRGRTFDKFYYESLDCGYPSFKDEEVVWENVRSL